MEDQNEIVKETGKKHHICAILINKKNIYLYIIGITPLSLPISHWIFSFKFKGGSI